MLSVGATANTRLASLTAVAELGSEELGRGSGLQQRRGQAPAQQPRHGGVGSRALNTLALSGHTALQQQCTLALSAGTSGSGNIG